MDFIWQCVIAFFAMVAMDFAYAAWVSHISAKSAMKSSVWAVVIILLSGVVTSSYVHDPWLLVPVAFGAFVGTWLSIKKEQIIARLPKWKFNYERWVEINQMEEYW